VGYLTALFQVQKVVKRRIRLEDDLE